MSAAGIDDNALESNESTPLSATRFKIAAAHAAPVLLDKAGSLTRAIHWIEEAGKRGVRLLGFPETFVPGYPYWLAVYSLSEQTAMNRRYFDESVTISGPDLDGVKAACKAHKVNVVLGISERDQGTLYNSQLFISDNGTIVGIHRKLQPTMPERYLWGQGDGSTLKAFDLPVGRVGGLICGENSMNLARHALILQHEQIHVASWPGLAAMKNFAKWFTPHVAALSRVHAYSGGCFVVAAQDPMTQANIDVIETALGAQDKLQAGSGTSAIHGPMGGVIASSEDSVEGLVIAEIDYADIASAKLLHDSAGHSARSEILSMWVDTARKDPLRTS
jgi:predicted amidohydrolase